ncbi:unnamed protein product [Brassicogethes aeneus]|uniref:Uncharacterized protein n=1 Tax=Brassicogethes aeneus TaxID=1431903 RepID=A0A9P0BC16_BRAAE|nr:unnamed protein product [Brassicogethes aeneus]
MSGNFCNVVSLLVFWVCYFQFVHCGFSTTKIGPPPIWNSTHTDKLRQDLLLNYDKFARPAQHYNTTIVKFGISIYHVEVDEFKSTMTVHSWLRLMWTDEKLKWSPADYGNLETLNLADHEIWQPDVFLYNSATAATINHYANTHCIVYENGEVLWVPPTQFTVLCQLNLRYWPFDTQECFLKFGSWTYNGDQIDLEIMQNQTVVEKSELMIQNSEWNMVQASLKKSVIYYSCCKEPYPDITITLNLERVSPSYRAIIVTPAFVIILLTLISFWLPPSAGEKIIINSCTAIIICIFLLYFSQKLPAMGTHTPLIVLFYCSALYIVSFSLIGSVIVIWISRTQHTNSLPWILKKPLTGTFGSLLGLGTYMQHSSITTTHRVTAEEMRDHQVTDFDDHSSDENHIIRTSSVKPSVQHDWILFAAAIDRISFCFYCFLFAILAIVYAI